ncbi:MAG TPA: bifunctional phosphoribosyl-AMP cyclohydrolase/phosphoribosyl-ATP diphosphatase HisIE [Longimicrobiaceae bacterium]|nr:bifunctional phosphoribosyl-AMP cyclohydrolase/phosphoribosyl-ATP diphosphatase HisIE [Longimicrobiaceae bacterium]
MSWIDQLKFDERGLVPVVAQEADTGEVLMVAYADREALLRTRETGRAHYWSRSRGALWQKGETSGHVQEVREVRVDCDGDAVLYRVAQTGPACHTGEGSCFHRRPEGDGLATAPGSGHILSRMEEIVRAREAERPPDSYTTYLFEKGVDKILKKIGEETAETIVAAKNPGTDELRSEVADLLFHLLVLLRVRELPLAQVWKELEERFGAPPRDPGAPRARRDPDHS